ncbi:MAG: nucleotidyltransferase family protein [Candidatus Omnitrophica bacterium]|nr:nucleotidyltransferase family protein [Candidatus Omnitrophota bacterium]
MHTQLDSFCIGPSKSIHDAIRLMDKGRIGIVLVVDTEYHLLGTVTDGDIRRAILANVDIALPVDNLLERKEGTRFSNPVTSRVGKDRSTYLNLLKQHRIHHLPIVDEGGHLVGLVTSDDFLPDQTLPVQAVVMAGGKGSRLHPLTREKPKPLLDVGGRPLLEIIIQQLQEAGIQKVKVATHHQAKMIKEHFGDGRNYGVDLSFTEEDRPLGTGGGLGLLEIPCETTLVMNGDILTQVDFRAMLMFHREHRADLTIAVRSYEIKIPYGVVECDGPVVSGVREKPVMTHFINAGIYLLEPLVYGYIPKGQRFDMTDLIQGLIDDGRLITSFPIRENWMDIGQHADYEEAQKQVTDWEMRK